jgi:eukaryotic-like serine/threonine-protein kinase
VAVDETPLPQLAEHSLSLAGSTIKARYRVKAVSAVRRDVVLYAAEELRYGRPVTLEVLRDEVAAHPEFVAAVRAQASTLAMSPHAYRGLPRVYECDVTETGALFIALEPVTGITLRELIGKRGPLDLHTALRVASQVGEALETLHHNRLVHGELRPDSVLVATDPTGVERVTLVGVELTAAYRTPIGRGLREDSPLQYLAPEQIEQGVSTAASDQYAFGLLLAELLSTNRAGATADVEAPPPAVPPSIERIMTTALAERPEHRYANISVMMNDLWGAQTALVPDEGRARAVKLAAATGRKQRNRTRLSGPLAAGVVTAAVILVLSVVLVDRLVLRPRARGDAPPVSPVTLDQRAAPPDDRRTSAEVPPAPSAMPAVRTAPARIAEPQAVKQSAPGDMPAPAIRGDRSAPSGVPQKPAATVPSLNSPSRRVESAAPAARSAHATPRKADEGDGSAIIDWLLQNQR